MTDSAVAGLVAVVGEALIDLVPVDQDGLFEAVPGGSPANVAIGLARLGVPVRLAARLADDGFGRRLRDHLAANSVDLSLAVSAREPSSVAIVQVDRDGAVTYDFRVHATADWQWTDVELAVLPDERTVALHTGSLAAALLPGAEAIARLAQRSRLSTTISYDPNCRPALMRPREAAVRRIQRLVSLADVIKVSVEDLAWLAPSQAPAEVAAEWVRRGAAIVVVTLGAGGVLAYAHETGKVSRPSVIVEVADTVGAGDAFASALLAGLHRRDLLGGARRDALRGIGKQTLSEILAEATVASAITCTRRGADPPTRRELCTFLDRA